MNKREEIENINRPITSTDIETRPFGTKTPKRCPLHYTGLECKRKKSRNTWSNRKIWLWSME